MKVSNHLYFAAAFLISITPSSYYGTKLAVTKSKIRVQLHEIPVLCYHQIRERENTDSKNSRTYIMPTENFRKHMKTLADSGYHSILPDQLVSYEKAGEKLPHKPIMITFDDGTASQFINAIPILNDYGFKAVFFIMTVVLNHGNFMSSQQVKSLADQGHIVGCHTWDHHSVTKYKDADWKIQFENPKSLLEKITSKPVVYFAYPYGSWNQQAIDKLKMYGFTAAFQLAEKRDLNNPLFTIRRIMVDGNWNEKQLMNAIKYSFK